MSDIYSSNQMKRNTNLEWQSQYQLVKKSTTSLFNKPSYNDSSRKDRQQTEMEYIKVTVPEASVLII